MTTPAEKSDREDRHEDRGRAARQDGAPKRVRTEHVIATVIGALLTGGQVKTALSSSGLEEGLKTQGIELRKAFEAQSVTLQDMKLSLAEMRAHGEASDKANDRLVSELARVMVELRELRDGSVRSATRQDEHDRRLKAVEEKK